MALPNAGLAGTTTVREPAQKNGGRKPDLGRPLRINMIGLAGFALLAIGFLLYAGDGYLLNVGIRVLLFCALCAAWNIVGGFAGQFAFAHSLFIGAGAYSVALAARAEVTPFLGILVGIAVAVVLAAIVAWVSFRFALPHLSFALITLAFSEIGLLVVLAMDALGGPAGLSVPFVRDGSLLMYQFSTDIPHFLVALFLALLSVGIGAVVAHNKLGYQFRCIRENERAAQAIGIDPLRAKLSSMCISAALSAAAGGAFAMFIGYVDPHLLASPVVVIEIILFTAIGGMGTVWGPVVGAVLLVPVADILRAQFGGSLPPGVHVFFYGAVVVVVILFAREGIVAVLKDWWAWMQARRSERSDAPPG